MSGRRGNAVSERCRLLPSSPPPLYNHVVNLPVANGRSTSTEPISKPVTAKFYAGNRLKLILAIGSLAVVAILTPFLWIQVQKHSQCVNVPDPIERARIVSEWQNERDAFAVESDGWKVQRKAWMQDERHHREELALWESERTRREVALRQWEKQKLFDFEVEKERARRAFEDEERGWAWRRMAWINAFEVEKDKARKEFRAEKHGWDESRKDWTEEQRRWASERRRHEDEKRRWSGERAREMGRMWDASQGEECRAYNMRQYSVRIDAHAICKIAPITMRDHTMMAETCEVQNGQVVGRYKAPGDSFCQFQWNGMHDKQCTTRGQTSGTRTFEARLGGLHRDRRENWLEMCNTTPASLHGLYFSRPTRCIQDKDGMSGEFDFDDPTCTWNDLRNSLKETS